MTDQKENKNQTEGAARLSRKQKQKPQGRTVKRADALERKRCANDRRDFVLYKDFLERSKLSVFISTLPTNSLISIESIPLVMGEIGAVEKFRVWFYKESE